MKKVKANSEITTVKDVPRRAGAPRQRKDDRAMMYPVEEVRIAPTHPVSVEGSCLMGLAGDDLVRIRSANGHVFHVRFGGLLYVVERMKQEAIDNPPLFGGGK